MAREDRTGKGALRKPLMRTMETEPFSRMRVQWRTPVVEKLM